MTRTEFFTEADELSAPTVLRGAPLRALLAAPTREEERAGIVEVPYPAPGHGPGLHEPGLADEAGATLWPHTRWLLGSMALGALAVLLWAGVPNAWGGLAAFHALCGSALCWLVSVDRLEEFHGHWEMHWYDPDLSAVSPDMGGREGRER